MEDKEEIFALYCGQVKRNKEIMNMFIDEDLQKVVGTWIVKGKYEKLLELWVKGLNVDWNMLYGEERPNRISLPTYPFAKEHYWVTKYNKVPVHSSSVNTMMKDTFLNENGSIGRPMKFLRKYWEPSVVEATREMDRTIVILTTEDTMGLAIQLSYHFSKSKILDIHDLKSELQQPEYEWENYDGCVDLIGCGMNRNDSTDWIMLLQRFIEHGHKNGLMMLCVTKGLESYQNPDVNLSGASRVGLYRMLQSEYGHTRSRHMDVDLYIDDRVLAEQIASEFLLDSENPEICYRNGNRYRAYLGDWEENEQIEQTFVFPEDRVLWITGGTRGLGYLCAQHFVTNYGVKRLVLTGREEFPPKEQWESYKRGNNSLAQKIQAIQDLEAQGVQVQVLSISLTDMSKVQKSLQEIKDSMGPIGGFIHCAGINDSENPALIRKSIDGMRKVLNPKVTGLDILYQCFKNEPLQCFILFSSVSAIIPTLASGQSDYAMANAYMDYFAEANSHSCPIVSIQWPSWKEIGLGEIKSRAYLQTGLQSLKNLEGLRLLDQILSRKMGPVILPAVVNSDLWNPNNLMKCKIKEVSSINSESQSSRLIDLSNTSDSLVVATQTWLIELFARELKIDPMKLEKDKPFADYGVDSVLLAQLSRSINQMVEKDIDPSALFEYPTIESLATWITSTHASSISKLLRSSISEKHTLSSQGIASPMLISSSENQRTWELQKESQVDKQKHPVDIAVVGISCSFPGANTLEEYWRLLVEGKSAIRSVPQERWGNTNDFYAGLLDNITQFDPEFFLIPKEDAKVMDPQALVVLEEALKLWYQSGYSHEEIKGKSVGVYLGARSQHQPDESSVHQSRNPIVVTGQNYLAANISQFFDLRGPSLVVDTACSSALVGMNMAIQSLQSGDIEAAVVGGVSLLSKDETHRIFERRGILNPEPAFHIFDQRARGVTLGEGVGMVLLKTVDQAIKDGDQIYAVIKALSINNDGRTVGPATPNIHAQKEVMKAALFKSNKRPEEIDYIEVNGSGSEVTDLLELKAIQSVYRSSNSNICGLGSIKPNIGHPLCAEGIASFIKVVLMLKHQKFVPFLSGEQPMQHYNIESSPFYFCRELMEWKNINRVAAINCFADGGTNVHAIVEDWKGYPSRQIKRYPLTPPVLNRYAVKGDLIVNSAFSQTKRDIDSQQQIFENKTSIWKRKLTEG
nr:type I polyketide synthase [Bacillus wiedmannii]